MVTAMLRRQEDGIRPISLRRDLYAVIELIAIAFGDTLDAHERRALRSMRLPRLLLPWFSLVDSLSPPGEGMMPGFVWVEGGRVVGTASIRRLHSLASGWLLNNVAVHPDHRGRGHGRALVQASIDYALVHGARWITLQVRSDNPIAQGLYTSLGFRKTATLIRFRLATSFFTSPVSRPAPPADLRPARSGDNQPLRELARQTIPSDLIASGVLRRESYQVGAFDWLLRRFKSPHKRWWVMGRRRLSAAVGVELNPQGESHCLRLLVAPDVRSESLASGLIAYGLDQLRTEMPTLPIEVEHPADDAETLRALAGAGFEKVWELIHMRLRLSSRL